METLKSWQSLGSLCQALRWGRGEGKVERGEVTTYRGVGEGSLHSDGQIIFKSCISHLPLQLPPCELGSHTPRPRVSVSPAGPAWEDPVLRRLPAADPQLPGSLPGEVSPPASPAPRAGPAPPAGPGPAPARPRPSAGGPAATGGGAAPAGGLSPGERPQPGSARQSESAVRPAVSTTRPNAGPRARAPAALPRRGNAGRRNPGPPPRAGLQRAGPPGGAGRQPGESGLVPGD